MKDNLSQLYIVFSYCLSSAPTDCYERNGTMYRGVVSMTEDGQECLDWHSYFILQHGEDPYITYSGFDGLENNHCRYNQILFLLSLNMNFQRAKSFPVKIKEFCELLSVH